MPPISYKYLEKLRKEVADLDVWLNGRQADGDGSARQDDLRMLYNKVHGLYQKALALHQTTIEEPTGTDELNELRLDVAKFDYWLATEINQPSPEEAQVVFTRANAISLKALGFYRQTSQQAGGEPQEPAGDEHASLSGA